jgi:hypothetical protein
LTKHMLSSTVLSLGCKATSTVNLTTTQNIY